MIERFVHAAPILYVSFNTGKPNRWETDVRRCHINWVILDSDWDAEFTEVYRIEADFKEKVESHFHRMVERFAPEKA